MYVYSERGDHLAFLDAFGLTRWTAPGKVKTDRTVHGGRDSLLARSAAGDLVAAYDDEWMRAYVYKFPALTAAQKLPRFAMKHALLHPSGTAWVTAQPQPDGGAMELVVTDRASGAVVTTVLPSQPQTEVLQMGAGEPGEPAWETTLRIAPDGSFALWVDRIGTLYLGTLRDPAQSAELTAVVPFHPPAVSAVSVDPRADGTFVVAHEARHGRAHAAVLDPRGAVVGKWTFECLGAPVRAGDSVVFQRDEGAVVRLPLSHGGGPAEVFPLAPEHAGAGTVMAHPARVHFLPWHGDDLLDLTAGVTVSRKLPPAEAPLRRWLMDAARRMNAAGRKAGFTMEVSALTVTDDGGFKGGIGSSRGDGSLLAQFVSACASRIALGESRPAPGFRCRVWGRMGEITLPSRPADGAEVAAAFERLADQGLSLMDSMEDLRDPWDRAHGYDSFADVSPRRPAAPWMTPDGERVFLRTLFAALASPTPAPPSARGAMAETPVTVAEALSGVAPLEASASPRWWPFGTTDLVARLVASQLGETALPVLLHLAFEHPDPGILANYGNITRVITRWIVRHPEQRAAALEAIERPGAGAAGLIEYHRRQLHEALAREA